MIHKKHECVAAREVLSYEQPHEGKIGSSRVGGERDSCAFGSRDVWIHRRGTRLGVLFNVWRMSGFLPENRSVQTLWEILSRLKQAHCGTIGYEYMHIQDHDKRKYLRENIETVTRKGYNAECGHVMLDQLIWSS